MRAGGLPLDGCIRDISARGILFVASSPPQRGTIVEILDLYAPVIGQVVWTNGHRCGISLRGRIDVAAAVRSANDPGERRKSATIHEIAPRRPAAPAQTLSKSRDSAAMLQYSFIVIGGICAAFGIGHTAYDNLNRALDPVQAELSR